jgi:hypothetical protein
LVTFVQKHGDTDISQDVRAYHLDGRKVRFFGTNIKESFVILFFVSSKENETTNVKEGLFLRNCKFSSSIWSVFYFELKSSDGFN